MNVFTDINLKTHFLCTNIKIINIQAYLKSFSNNNIKFITIPTFNGL